MRQHRIHQDGILLNISVIYKQVIIMEKKKIQDIEIMLCAKDIQEIMGMNKNLAYKLISQPDFPKITINGRFYIPADAFRAWCKKYVGKTYTL